ncbi:hypothetical protein PIB30_102066, partial [Stylosanthes scabra]|nr:hypothetical protein [Stylosanthes scabra]
WGKCPLNCQRGSVPAFWSSICRHLQPTITYSDTLRHLEYFEPNLAAGIHRTRCHKPVVSVCFIHRPDAIWTARYLGKINVADPLTRSALRPVFNPIATCLDLRVLDRLSCGPDQ